MFGLGACGDDPCVFFPDGYESGTPLSFSAQFDRQSFQSLGINATDPISFMLGEDNTINLDFSTTAVIPLPPALPLLGAALLGLGALGRRAQRRTGPRTRV